jgi:hypothetical protein
MLWAANDIDRRYASHGLRALSVQLSGVHSGLLQFMSQEEQTAILKDPILAPQLKNAEQGAATSTWAAISKFLEGMGGYTLRTCRFQTVG